MQHVNFLFSEWMTLFKLNSSYFYASYDDILDFPAIEILLSPCQGDCANLFVVFSFFFSVRGGNFFYPSSEQQGYHAIYDRMFYYIINLTFEYLIFFASYRRRLMQVPSWSRSQSLSTLVTRNQSFKKESRQQNIKLTHKP